MKLDAGHPDLGRVGVWAWGLVTAPAPEVRSAVAAIEDLGYGAVWFPESRGREAIALSALILSATPRLKVATGIANIWARDANSAAGAAQALGEAWPGRFTLGLGVSHAPSVARRGHHYASPVERMTEYLDRMESAEFVGPEPGTAVPVLLAALGPRMLDLAARRTSGAHPYFVPVDHTERARQIMGDEPFLAPEQAVALESDPDRARRIGRDHMERYLLLDNYRRNLLRLGWSERDLEDGGSDALVDAIVAWGEAPAIAERIAAHHEAGADHVAVQVLSSEGGIPVTDLRALASYLL